MGRLIIIALCIYLAYTWIIKPLLKVLLQNMVKKAAERHFGPMNNQKQPPPKPEGTIQVDYIPRKDKKGHFNDDIEGEYIDYEEVK